MAKKKAVKKVKEPVVPTFVGDYDLKWMQEMGEDHPDYNKVMKEARKKKYI